MRRLGFGLVLTALLSFSCTLAVIADPETTLANTVDLIGKAIDEASDVVPDAMSGDPAAPADVATTPQNRPVISWRVANPFRLFENPAHADMHRATWASLSDEEKRAPILSAERALSSRHSDGWAADVYRKTCWDTTRNRHKCSSNENFMNPKAHKIFAEVSGIVDAETVVCRWTIETTSKTQKSESERPCSDRVELDLPYPSGGRVRVAIGGRDIAQIEAKVTDLLIVGMGDSFASGEGNPDVPVRFSPERDVPYGVDKPSMNYSLTGFPARIGPWRDIGDRAFLKENAKWLDQACHRSLYSHQLRAALQLAIENPHRAVTFVGLACSGAQVTDGMFLRYKGHEWVPSPPDLSQVSAAAVAQCGETRAAAKDYPEAYHMRGKIPELENILVLQKCARNSARKIDLMFVSIGGNDIGFARLVANAVLADKSTLKQLGGWFGQVFQRWQAEAKLKGLKHRYKSLKRAFHNVLHLPWSEPDRVILTGYPGLAFLGDGKRVCPDGRAGMEIVPAYKLSEKRVRESVAVAKKLNNEMRSQARRHGWRFADSHRPQFNGRGVCAGYIENSFSVADDLRLPRKVDGKWVPYNPSQYRAYASRQRWFRTPNDAFMTGNFHVSQTKLPKALRFNGLGLFQLILASTYSGAYHPTAEGQAAIADAVTIEARKVLAKYGQDTTPTEAAAIEVDVSPADDAVPR